MVEGVGVFRARPSSQAQAKREMHERQDRSAGQRLQYARHKLENIVDSYRLKTGLKVSWYPCAIENSLLCAVSVIITVCCNCWFDTFPAEGVRVLPFWCYRDVDFICWFGVVFFRIKHSFRSWTVLAALSLPDRGARPALVVRLNTTKIEEERRKKKNISQ